MAVEPENCPTLNVALKKGKPSNVSVSGVAASALGAKSIGNICFNLSKENQIESLVISDDEIETARRLLWENHRIFVEPAGAAALAAIISGKYKPKTDRAKAAVKLMSVVGTTFKYGTPKSSAG